MAGRRTKLTPELQKSLCELLAAGSYIESACDYVGIGVSTYHNWIVRGEAEIERREELRVKESSKKWDREQVFVEFVEATKKARSQSETKSLARIRKAGQGGQLVSETVTTKSNGDVVTKNVYTAPQWQADAWYLERSAPSRWGRRVVDVNSRNLNIDVSTLDDEQLQRIAQGEDPLSVVASTSSQG